MGEMGEMGEMGRIAHVRSNDFSRYPREEGDRLLHAPISASTSSYQSGKGFTLGSSRLFVVTTSVVIRVRELQKINSPKRSFVVMDQRSSPVNVGAQACAPRAQCLRPYRYLPSRSTFGGFIFCNPLTWRSPSSRLTLGLLLLWLIP